MPDILEGHVFLPQGELIVAAQEELEVDAALLAPQLAVLAADGGVMVEAERVYLPPLYCAEVGATESLQRLLRGREGQRREEDENLDEILALLEKHAGIEYEGAQKAAIRTAAAHKVMVLTGGPGTGKTTITQGIIGLFEQQRLRVVLCSPTGRAAKKLFEATRRPARTIHRLLGFKPPDGFEYNRDNPLKTDAVVVDEVSMVDTALLNSSLKAVPTAARLVLVGGGRQRAARPDRLQRPAGGAADAYIPAGAGEPDRHQRPQGQPGAFPPYRQ